MASMDSQTPKQQTPSFKLTSTTQKFARSFSNKDQQFTFSQFPYSPPRFSTSNLPTTSSFPLCPSPPHNPLQNDAAYTCLSSILKKDGQILSMAISNGLLYTGSGSNVIRVWKFPDFAECQQLKTRTCMVVALLVSHDHVFAAYGDSKIRVWRRTWDGRGFRHVRAATIPKSGGYVRSYIAGKDKMMKHRGLITSLAINITDDILYSSSIDKTVKVWRLMDFKCIETIQAHSDPINAVVVANDGVLYTASDDATVRVWRRILSPGEDHHSHSLTVTLPAKNSPVKSITLDQINGFLYGGCSDGYIHYWQKGCWISGQYQYGGAMQGHTHAIMCITNVRNYVFSGSADSTCRVWIREPDDQHSCIAVLVGHRGPIRSVTACDNEHGCLVCTGSLDGVMKIWSVKCKNKDSGFELQQQK